MRSSRRTRRPRRARGSVGFALASASDLGLFATRLGRLFYIVEPFHSGRYTLRLAAEPDRELLRRLLARALAVKARRIDAAKSDTSQVRAGGHPI